MANQRSLKCTIMRGGTSRGVFIKEGDLPPAGNQRDKVILRVMGSPDRRQIDGLAGADPLTSKIAIIGPGKAFGADVTYTFGQVDVEQPVIDYSQNCGNISSAVGVYAIEEGYVLPVEPETTVSVWNTNTNKELKIIVPIKNGAPAVDGNFHIDGVPGTAAEVRLDFSNTVGANTGALLPSGHVVDKVYVPELGKSIEISVVDVSKATLFFHPEDLGIKGTEGPTEFTPELLQMYWAVRRAAAKLVGLPEDGYLPTPVSVTAPVPYTNFETRQTVSPDKVTMVARRVIGPTPTLHKAFAGTGAICTALAALIPGTVVNQVSVLRGDNIIRIGHPSGVFYARARLAEDNRTVLEASYSRTARRIMEGYVMLPGGL